MEDNEDFLHIHDGGSDDLEIIANLTGTINETKISIAGNQMFVVFHTNDDIVKNGFHALIMESKCTFIIGWVLINCDIVSCIHYFLDDHCQYWLNETAGMLTSPNFANYGEYDHNLNCTWILHANEGFYVTIKIEHFFVSNE